MSNFKPITEWTTDELVEAAKERGTGLDPIFDEMLRRLDGPRREVQELEEIADGAWGDGPRRRGLARDRLKQIR